MRRKIAVAITIATFASACAQLSSNQKRSIGEDEAIIKGTKSSLVGSLLLPIGTHADVVIKSVDDRSLAQNDGPILKKYPVEVVVTPGRHAIGYYCSGTADNVIDFKSESTLDIEVIGGREYRLVPGIGRNRTCTITVSESS
jgi:hypothetical protein